MKAQALVFALLVVFATTMPILAQGNGNGGGTSGGSDNNDIGNNGGGNGGGPTTSHRNAEPTVVPEADLLSMVEAGQAVSLGSLLPDVQWRTGGEIVDAQLVHTEGSLIYIVKVLTPDGSVGVEYYDARSGSHIGE